MAAGLIYLIAIDSSEKEKIDIMKGNQVDLMKLIESAKKENLITTLLAILDEYPEWEDQARILLQPGKSIKSIDYDAMVSRYIAKNTNYSNYMDYYTLNDVGSHFTALLSKVSETGKWADQVKLSMAIIKQLNEQIYEIDDSEGQVSGAILYAFKLLMEKVPSLSEEQRKGLFKELIFLLQTPEIYQWNCGVETWHIICNLVENEEDWQVFNKILKTKIPTATDHLKEEIATCSLVSLKKINKSEADIKAFCLENKEIPRIAEELVGMAVREENFVLAREIIAEGIKLAKERNHKGVVNQWYRNYLTVAIMENNLMEISKWSRFMFFEDFNMDDYEFFKEHNDTKNWPNELQKLITDLKICNYYYKHNILQKVYATEQMLDELFFSVENHSSEFYEIDEYEETLKLQNKKRLVDIYENRIRKYLIGHISRQYYKVAASYIKKIKKLGGEKRANDLVSELRVRYKNRKALIEELKTI